MDQTVDYLFIKNAPAEVVFKELQRLTADRLSSLSEDLELELLSRDEPLINIALGLFGDNLEVVKQLYETDCIDTKVACLSGRSIAQWPLWCADRRVDYYKQVLSELVSTWDRRLLVALFSNNSISQDVLLGLYEKREPYKDLDNDAWLDLITLTAGAKCLHQEFGLYSDPSSEYEYNKLLRAIWQLYNTVDSNERNARMLFPLTRDLEPAIPDGMNILEVQEKWNIEESGEHSLPYAREALARLEQVSPDNVRNKETQEDIESKIEAMLEEFSNSDISLINQYNQEFRMLKDTVTRLAIIDDNVVTLKARKVLNDSPIMGSIIVAGVLLACIWLYNFVTDGSSVSIGQLMFGFLPLLYFVRLLYENASFDKQILAAADLKADLLIGVDRDILRLFQTVKKAEDLDWEQTSDKDVQCATARFNLIRSLIYKFQFASVEGREQYIF